MDAQETHSALPALWIPVAVLAHAFAAVWLIRAFQLFQPAAWYRVIKLVRQRRVVKAVKPSVPAAASDGSGHSNNDTACINASAVSYTSDTQFEHRDHQAGCAASPVQLAANALPIFILPSSCQGNAVVEPLGSSGSAAGSSTVRSRSDSTSSIRSNSDSLVRHSLHGSGDGPCHAVVVVQPAGQECKPFNTARPVACDSLLGLSPAEQQQPQKQPILFEWHSIGCSYQSATGSKSVLQGVFGSAAAGQIQALLGPSGAGKSTLLDILAGRKATGTVTGGIMLDRQPLSLSNRCSRQVAYVPQDENFVPVMTCLEALSFHAAMLLADEHHHWQHGQPPQQKSNRESDSKATPRTVASAADAELAHQGPAAQQMRRLSVAGCRAREQQQAQQHCSSRQWRVHEVLQVVGLSQHSNTLVGGRLPGGLLLRGLSSGERRRLAIAAGTLAAPDVLLLDEPTSGLDSSAALSVMTHLQQLAHVQQKVVLTAVHQPRSAIWSLFDKVTLLASGLLLYHGPTGDMAPWLATTLGQAYDPLKHGLASDWALDLAAIDFHRQSGWSGSMVSLLQLRKAAILFEQRYVGEQPGTLHHQQQQVQQQQVQQQHHQQRQLQDCKVALQAGHADKQAPAVTAQQGLPPQGPFSRGGSFTGSFSFSSNGGANQQHTDAPPSECTCGATQLDPGQLEQERDDVLDDLTAAVTVLKTLSVKPFGVLASSTPASESIDVTSQQSERHKAQKLCSSRVMTDSRTLTDNCYTADQQQYPAAAAAGQYATSWWQQYKALAWRECLKVTRNPADVAGRTLTFAWVALVVGLIYYDLPVDASSIRQRLNLLFASLCFFLLMPFIGMSMYTADKGVYLADVSAQLYQPSAYYMAKVTVILPFNIFSALCYCFIQYGMTGLRPGATAIMQHGAIGALVSLIAVQVLHLAATLTPNQDAAFMIGIGWTCVNLVMSGFFIAYREMRFQGLANLRYLSALHYAFEGMLQVELKDRNFSCPARGLDSQTAAFLTQLLPDATSLATPALLKQLTNGQMQEQCLVSSNAVTEYFSASRSFGETVAILAGYLGILHVVTFVAMLLIARRENR